jgi:hypothetical protein
VRAVTAGSMRTSGYVTITRTSTATGWYVWVCTCGDQAPNAFRWRIAAVGIVTITSDEGGNGGRDGSLTKMTVLLVPSGRCGTQQFGAWMRPGD